MAIVKKDSNFMGLPVNIARGNPIPLDKSEIWYSYDEMISYAQSDPTAYVGQILGLVNENDKTATAYIILNVSGEVQEVGKATQVDATTIVLEDEKLSLKDFGKRFYKYVPESGSQETGTYVAASYVPQEVDAKNPWKAGLELKVVYEDGKFAIGWYEPNPTTMEGINSQITGIQNTVNDLTTTTQNLSNRFNNVYTKSETDAAIAAAAHLKRKKVNTKEEINLDAPDAEQYIYMVPTGLTSDDNKYNEYIVIETKIIDEDGDEVTVKALEPVGSWEVDLSDYLLKADADISHTNILNQLTNINEALNRVDAKAETNVINQVSNSFKIGDNRTLELVTVPTSIDLASNTSLLSFFVKRDKDRDLVSNSEIAKLLTIEEYAEKNIINDISEEFNIDEIDRKLSILSIDGGKIINLSNNIEFNQVKSNVSSAVDNINSIQAQLGGINSSITTIYNKFVLKETYNNDMSEVWDRLTWHELL